MKIKYSNQPVTLRAFLCKLGGKNWGIFGAFFCDVALLGHSMKRDRAYKGLKNMFSNQMNLITFLLKWA
ncbi:hypothetical protein CF117_09800 [Aeromonas veronii]|nr:hypothetical protein CF117_09800 [Aeromonas veronii]